MAIHPDAPRNNKVNRTLLLEIMVNPNLCTTCRSSIYKNPFLPTVLTGMIMYSPVIDVQSSRAKIGRCHCSANKVRLSNPRALGMWENDADGMASLLELVDEGMYVGRRNLRGRAIIIYYL